MSMIRYIDGAASDVAATLLYSASTPSELMFHDELMEIEDRNNSFRSILTITQPTGEPWDGRVGRINEATLGDAELDLRSQFFICGPPAMIQDMVALLQKMGVAESNIHYEQWW